MDRITTKATFLPGSSTKDELEKLVRRSSRVWAAVAYWGTGAVEWLRAESLAKRDIIIVCDLMSGACNPNEISLLRCKLGNERVLKLNRLHAKTWLGDKWTVVGSANVSANGLGFEGTDLVDVIEASLYTDDSSTIAAVEHWFKNHVLPNATEISEADLQAARELWNSRWRPPPLVCSSSGSLLEALQKAPSSFSGRDLLVWIYDEDEMSKGAAQKLQTARGERRNERIDAWENVDPKTRPGSIIVDFWIDARRRAKLQGLWQVLRDEPLIKMGSGRNILLCLPRDNAFGLPLGDRKVWEQAATRARKEIGKKDFELSASEFASRFLLENFS